MSSFHVCHVHVSKATLLNAVTLVFSIEVPTPQGNTVCSFLPIGSESKSSLKINVSLSDCDEPHSLSGTDRK